MPRKIIAQIAILASVFFLSIGLQGFAAFRQPTQAPPYGNASAPINIGSTAQTKTGSLTVGDTHLNYWGYGVLTSQPIHTGSSVAAGNTYLNYWGYGVLTSQPISSDSYIRTHSSVRSPYYCNEAGTVCKSANALVSGSGGGSISCTWGGTRVVPGNMYGCYDDLYVTCSGGKVTHMHFGC
ncbi:MAG TPA: hypothetical protein ENJ75_00135 [Candidatus Kaiserbacteria bacterium]|nr:hypothetical protein [Candidatus Kaiserbacteria bacterium]